MLHYHSSKVCMWYLSGPMAFQRTGLREKTGRKETIKVHATSQSSRKVLQILFEFWIHNPENYLHTHTMFSRVGQYHMCRKYLWPARLWYSFDSNHIIFNSNVKKYISPSSKPPTGILLLNNNNKQMNVRKVKVNCKFYWQLSKV